MLDYTQILSQTVQQLKPSGIRRFFDIAAEMQGVISIRQAGIASLQKGRTWYSPNTGLKELKVEISRYLHRRFDLTYDPVREVMVTVGGSEAIDDCIRALVNPGDEVLIPEPCFVCYAPIVELSGGVAVPIVCRSQDAFRLTAQALKKAITPKSKLLIFPFPNNPTGAVMRREHLLEIAQVLRDTQVMVLSDEIYAELTYGGERHVSIASIPGMWERTVVVNGFSKAYAMTGWRLGYAAGPASVLVQMGKIHQYAIMCAPTTSQYAAVEAMRNGDSLIQEMVLQYDMRRRLVCDGFNRMGLTCFEPQGAFYVFPSIRSTGMSSQQFCEELLYAKKVAVIPGDAFGQSGEGHVRVSYSYSVQHLVQALERIREFLQERDLLP